MCTDPNNIENFPIETLSKSYPFFIYLAEDLIYKSLTPPSVVLGVDPKSPLDYYQGVVDLRKDLLNYIDEAVNNLKPS